MAIVLTTGLPGSGKTTLLAERAESTLKRFSNLPKLPDLPQFRLFSNIKFTPRIEKMYGVAGTKLVGKNGAQFINYFEDIYQMPTWTDSEIFIDESAVYFDSRGWETLPMSIRRFLFTHRHLGTNLHMIAQDFSTIDNSFRRLTSKLEYVHKIISTREPSPLRKPLKYPYNFCRVAEVKKSHWHLEKEHYEFDQTALHLFTRKHFDIFDTRQSLPEQALPPLRKEVRICPEDGYKKTRYI